MLFSSLIFLFYFLPAILLVYYVVPKKFKNHILLLFSLVFYAWGGVTYSIILIGSILFNYLFIKQIVKQNKHKRKWLQIGLFFNIALLGVFKYLDFFIENTNVLVTLAYDNFSQLPLANIVLPLGISFFTFQQISLLWDTFRAEKPAKPKFLETALYISFFPQLIAGPIVRYNDIIEQIKERKESRVLFIEGIERFVMGLFKKVIIANGCAVMADSIMDLPAAELSTPTLWLGIVAYTFQIFFDFSGYSDMAIGLGKMFGFRIMENFNFPYISSSIKEFWRRWHISLSQWFRDYVYIPLGGNRDGMKSTYRNLFLVFVLTGFWHGATWSFIFWGVFHGAFLILERLGFDQVLKKIGKPFSWAYTMVVVMIGWVFFRIEKFSDAVTYVKHMFIGTPENHDLIHHHLDKEKVLILLLAMLLSMPLFNWLQNARIKENILVVSAKYSLLLVLLVYCAMYINSGSYNPFIYFRF